MIKSVNERENPSTIEIDLTGPEGNAFYLLGLVKKFGKQLDWTSDNINEVTSEMMSGDYENLLSIFDKNFGEFVTLYN